MNERLKELRKAIGMTQQEFADSLGLSLSNIKSYETGRRNPSAACIRLICQKYSVSEEWLVDGIGEMFIDLTRNERILQFANSVMADEQASFRSRLVDALADLTEDEWEDLERIAKKLSKKK